MYDQEHQMELTDLVEVHLLVLPKVSDDDQSVLGHWLRLLKAKNEEDLKMLETLDPKIGKAAKIARRLSADEATRREYELLEKSRMDHQVLLRAAEKRGQEEGKREKALETAKIALQMNMDITNIMRLTDLSREEIETLR
jgi:predicted transposase/invertase (TIGR01784 family)